MENKIDSNIETVSFDIFDTLVHRIVAAPTDVFTAVTLKLSSHPIALKYHDIIVNFPVTRIAAEQEARQLRLAAHGGEGEIVLDEIYEQFAKQEKADIECISLLLETELELEKAMLFRSQPGYKLYREAVDQGKQILFISDMYLPRAFLSEVLIQLGYELACPNVIFVSGERRVSKHTAALYQEVAKERNLSTATWLHIGDNLHADIAMAQKAGLKTIHAHWAKVEHLPTRRPQLQDSFAASILKSLCQPQHQNEFSDEGDFFKMGYRVFGPVLFGFYAWLLHEMEIYGADKVLFFARDAHLVMQLHDQLVNAGVMKVNWKHDYVYISRKAALPLGVVDYPLERIAYWLPAKSKKTVADTLSNAGLQARHHISLIERDGLKSDHLIGESNWHLGHTLFNRLCPNLLSANVTARANFSEYFKEFLKDTQKVAIIDIGWSGNLYASYMRSLGDFSFNRKIEGFFLGVFENGRDNFSHYIRGKGWMVDHGEPKSRQELLWNGGVELLEFAFTSKDGSTLGYKHDTNGHIQPVLEIKEDEESEYERCAMELQRGMLAFAKRYAFLLNLFSKAALQSHEWIDPFFKMVANPTRHEANLFGDLTHSDSVGNNAERLPLAECLPLMKRLRKGKVYRRALNKAYWKSAFKLRNHRKLLKMLSER